MNILNEVTIKSTTEGSELLADILQDLESMGVAIYDNQDFLNLDKEVVLYDYVDEKLLDANADVLVKGYFTDEDLEEKLKQLNDRISFLKANSPFDLGSLEISINKVDADSWYDNWKTSYKVNEIGKVAIVPTWIDYKNEDNRVIVKLDPKMAFGSGEHESTRMCIEFLEEENVENKTVIDVGCGSGILAIIAKKLGAKEVEAYDIDDLAVNSAKENAQLNEVDIFVDNANLLSKTTKTFDVVLANITADVLILLSNTLKDYVKENGVIIVSGIIKGRENDVKEAFVSKGYTINEIKNEGEWFSFKMGM